MILRCRMRACDLYGVDWGEWELQVEGESVPLPAS
jgi:hypothetical protein